MNNAVVHPFRFHSDRFVDMWDIGLPMQGDAPNVDGIF
jgi:hypothetical protein